MEWAGVVLVNSQGEVLLNLRDDNPAINWPNCWDVIGGVVEDGENPDECILRETMEETGEDMAELRPFKVYEVPLEDGHAANLHMYWGRLDKPANELLLGEGQAHRFFSVDELADLKIVRGIRTVLQEFINSAAYRELMANPPPPGEG